MSFDVVRDAIRLSAVVATLLLGTACGNGGSGGGAASADEAAIRTLAYVVTDCEDRADGAYGRQRLEILSGDRTEAVVIKELDAFATVQAGVPFCVLAGTNRFSPNFLFVGVYQRLGVSPDATRVVFEITDDNITIPGTDPLPPLVGEDEGIFVVNADGSQLRRLAPPSREPPFRARGVTTSSLAMAFGFSPDSSAVVYADIGIGDSGEEAIQIVLVDLDTAERRQLTRLPPGPLFDPDRPATLSPFFLDNHRIAFYSTSNPDGLNPEGRLMPFIVDRTGTTLIRGTQPNLPAGGTLIPSFVVTGPSPSAVLLHPPGAPEKGPFDVAVLDVFALEGDNLLQLTAFGLDDITDTVISPDGERIFFNASADPCLSGSSCAASNPTRNCQIFSIDRTGGGLRRLTDFGSNAVSNSGCFYFPAGSATGCAASFLHQDPVTETLVFYSSCTPFAAPRFIGAQIYAMRPDGTGLRALTSTRGFSLDASRRGRTELPGPLAYSGAAANARQLR